MKSKKIICIILFLTVPQSLIAQDQSLPTGQMKITILRQHADENCASGYMSINEEIICYTLELPYRNNTPKISSIPSGTYNAFLRLDSKWVGDDRYNWGVIQLMDVPGRDGVQIHIGNTTADVEGCIMVGDALYANNICRLEKSTMAYAKLEEWYKRLNPDGMNEKDQMSVQPILVEFAGAFIME